MINPSRALHEFEARYGRDAYRELTYEQALAIFTALWVEARALNPDWPNDWEHDIEPDLAIARAVNGLPPAA
ncbi:MAG: hypothetical protein ACREOF_13270 [Gemmatimonadales bacterium]